MIIQYRGSKGDESLVVNGPVKHLYGPVCEIYWVLLAEYDRNRIQFSKVCFH